MSLAPLLTAWLKISTWFNPGNSLMIEATEFCMGDLLDDGGMADGKCGTRK
jgi:hypothetical protein